MRNSSLFYGLESLMPTQLRGYLVSHGWREESAIRDIASVWRRPELDKKDFEILQPEDKSIRDFSDRVLDMLQVLSEFEKRTIEDVFRDISNYFSDLIRIRISHNDVKNGSIPLDDGVLLIEKAKDLLASATLSTLSKKKYFIGSRPPDVIDFMDKARLGQTEIGSYVINIIAPLDSQENKEDELLERLSFSRIVTTTLDKGLSAISSTIDNFKRNNNFSVFDEAVEKGVSANLCDALIGLTGEKQSRDVHISISFSKFEQQEEELKIEHLFKPDIVPYLEKASEYLKENYVIPNITISGFVKKLDREKDKVYGLVTVTAVVEDRERNVTFELSGTDYLDAIHAHENKQIVQCTGNLYISPRSAKLTDNTNFRVIDSGFLFE